MIWNNFNNLESLKVEFNEKENELIFTSPGEKAVVKINGDNDIEYVVYSFNGENHRVDINERKHLTIGEENFKREVYHYLMPRTFAHHMRLGITKHANPGTWSSLPHDFELHPEPGFEEVFFYLIQGGSGRAIQVGKGVWCNNEQVDGAWIVKDRTISVVPMGYHPVGAEPHVNVSYIWVYLCKKPEWEKV